MPVTETIEYLFVLKGVSQTNADMRRAADGAERTADAIDDLTKSLQRTGRGARGASKGITKLDGAMRISRTSGELFGGTLGDILRSVDEIGSVGEGAAAALGPAGVAGVLTGIVALGIPVAFAAITKGIVDIGRSALSARDKLADMGAIDLLDTETTQALAEMDADLGRLDIASSRLAVSLGTALVPAIDMLANGMERIANFAESPLFRQLTDVSLVAQLEKAGGILGMANTGTAGGAALGARMGRGLGESIVGAFSSTEDSAAGGEALAFVERLKELAEADVFVGPTQYVGGIEEERGRKRGRFDNGIHFRTTSGGGSESLAPFLREMQNLGTTVETGFSAVGVDLEAQTEELRKAKLDALGAAVASGAVGGVEVGAALVRKGFAAIPVIGGFVADMLGILQGLPAFVDALLSTVANLPGQILGGVGDLISGLPSMLVDEFIPSLISGLVDGIATLFVAPFALIDQLPEAIMRLPGAIAEALAEALADLLNPFSGGGSARDSGGLLGTGALRINQKGGRGGLFGTGFADLTPGSSAAADIEALNAALAQAFGAAPGFTAGGSRVHGTLARIAEDEPEVVMPSRKAGIFPRRASGPAFAPTFVGVGADTADQLLTMLRLRQDFTGNGLQGF